MRYDDPRLKPNALPQVPVRLKADEWDNVVRAWGVGFCCEWFGHHYESKETELAYNCLKERNDNAELAKEQP